MLRLMLLTLACSLLTGCFRLTAVEHSVYGGLERNYSGGEIYADQPSGHQEQGGAWSMGTAIKTIWSR